LDWLIISQESRKINYINIALLPGSIIVSMTTRVKSLRWRHFETIRHIITSLQ